MRDIVEFIDNFGFIFSISSFILIVIHFYYIIKSIYGGKSEVLTSSGIYLRGWQKTEIAPNESQIYLLNV